MQSFTTFIFASIGIASLLFVVILTGTLFGGIAGWVIGLVFPYVIASLNTVLGLTLTGFEMGALLGFVGGFLSTTVRHNND